MRTPEQDLAADIYLRDGKWGMTGSLQGAIQQVALRGYHSLDDLSQMHVRVLAFLWRYGPITIPKIAVFFELDERKTLELLEALCEFQYAEEVDDGFQPTATGKTITRQVGIVMLGTDRYRMKGELERSERLLKELE